jgi:outer membrane protein OmpA-like peptidoglycan-associated protein
MNEVRSTGVVQLGNAWTIATSLGLVHIRLRRGGDGQKPEPAAPGSEARARFFLLFELERSREAQQALSDIARVTVGGQQFSSSQFQDRATGTPIAELTRVFDAELAAGRLALSFEPFPGVLNERDELDLQLPLGKPAAEPGPETTFIVVRLLDQKGRPLSSRPFQIELPDGSIRRGFTDPDGFGRVRGFTEDGTAKVIFPTFDELDFTTKNPTDKIVIPITLTPQPDPFAGLKSPEQAKQEPSSGTGSGSGSALPGGGFAAPPLATFTLFVLDDLGAPLPEVDLAFTLPGGELKVVTDGTGKAELKNAVGPVKATLLDLAQVRQILRPRLLTEGREPQPVADAKAKKVALSARMDPIELTPDVPATILLTPFIECHEIPGATFEFGRSYVRSSAIDQLAAIAEALRNTSDVRAMVFGHTDTSGGEALNKELSERRAKAVHALLSHDATAWEQLFSGTADGANWQEKWDIEETQNMLNALGCTDDEGAPLEETAVRDAPTKQAIRRFQRGEYPDKPAEQQPLRESDTLGADGRKELFLAYAKRVTRLPIAADRFAPIGGSPFMGCGEFNPLSLSARDEASRRVNVFLFDPVAEPDSLPCRLRQLPPCRANLDAAPTEPSPDGKPPFRCRIFQKLAANCTTAPSPDLTHDLILRFPLQLQSTNQLGHKYILESDDGTLELTRSLASDARANDDTFVELAFEHLPELHRYRLSCDDGERPKYVVFDFATLTELQDIFSAASIATDLSLPDAFLQAALTPSAAVDTDDGSSIRPDGTHEADDNVFGSTEEAEGNV